jgi:hypothetical protein
MIQIRFVELLSRYGSVKLPLKIDRMDGKIRIHVRNA